MSGLRRGVLLIGGFLFAVFCAVPGSAYASEGVTWEEQAERLQNVSATLIDGAPISWIPAEGWTLSAGAGLSLLPETNPTVGAKSEKVPASPAHAIPQVGVGYGLGFGVADLGARAWFGYLPSGVEQLVGIDAQMSQSAFGIAAGARFGLSILPFVGAPGVEMGWQSASAEVQGAITAEDANDTFLVDSQLLFFGVGVYPESFGLHLAVVLGTKSTESSFEIPSDNTKLELDDDLSDAPLPLWLQFQAGWKFPFGLSVGLAEIWVPDRVLMPRIFGQYEYSI